MAPHQALCSELLCHSCASLPVTGRRRKKARKCLATMQNAKWGALAQQCLPVKLPFCPLELMNALALRSRASSPTKPPPQVHSKAQKS